MTMNKFKIVAIAAILFMSCGNGNNHKCIAYVIDGDTVILDNEQRIRITGIDSPELSERGGIEARNIAVKLLSGKCLEFIPGKSIVTGKSHGHYGRLIGDFRLQSGYLFSETMLELGYAEQYQ